MRTIRGIPFSALLVLAFLITGCATTGGQSGSNGDNPSQISAEQMQEAANQHDTAYSVVQSLRPMWLRKRGRSSINNEGDIVVYVDGSRYGTPGELRNIPATEVASMRFLSAAEATNRYGTGHPHGAILVNTKT